MQVKANHIPHNMLKEVKVQIAKWPQCGTPILGRACTRVHYQLKNLGGGRHFGKTIIIRHQFVVAFQWIHVSNILPHFPHP